MKWLPSVVVAGSVLLKQRNQEMNATASVLGGPIKDRIHRGISLQNVFPGFF